MRTSTKTLVKSQGFTLIEIMIAMAIIAILAAIAIPGYQYYIEGAKRASLNANIDAMRLFVEDYYLENDTYLVGVYDPDPTNTYIPNPATATDKVTAGGAAGAIGNKLTTELQWTPQGEGAKFKYEITACDGGVITDCYKITATHFDEKRTFVEFQKTL